MQGNACSMSMRRRCTPPCLQGSWTKQQIGKMIVLPCFSGNVARHARTLALEFDEIGFSSDQVRTKTKSSEGNNAPAPHGGRPRRENKKREKGGGGNQGGPGKTTPNPKKSRTKRRNCYWGRPPPSDGAAPVSAPNLYSFATLS